MDNQHTLNQSNGFKKAWAGLLSVVAGLFLFAGTGYAQEISISGTVTDDSGEPLIGASVTVAGNSTVGAITDIDGNYSISVPSGTEALVYSYIGMTDVTEAINSRTVINVVLKAEYTALEATVVTAMGISKSEKSLSYNVQEMKLENVAPTGSFVNSLNGKVAGVTINTSSTGVGGGSRVVMRGTKSLSNNNNALYVIDGIPMPSLSGEQPEGVYAGAGQTGDGLSAINPDDIESISVLSGPSAAALYGSAAANGVVIITTKKGAKESLSINYSNTTEFSRAYIMPSFQNTYGPTEAGSYQSWGDKLDTPSSYNPRNFFQTGLNEVNSISLSQGTERNQIYVSLASTNAKGIIRNNDVDKYNFNVRNTTNFLKDKLTLDVSASYANIREQNMTAQGQYMNPVLPVYLFPAGDDFERLQIYERYDAERGVKTQYWPYGNDFAMQNPYWITENQKYVNNKNRFMASAQLSYKPLKWLTISARGKLDINNETHEKKFDAGTLTLFASKYGYYSKESLATTQKFGEVIASVNKYFGDNIVNLTATVGANIEDIQYSRDFVGGNLASVNSLFTFGNIDRTHSATELVQSGYHKQKQAIFANVQVGFKSMVYLDLTARNDWSSTLAFSKYSSVFYPTIGLSGIVTEFIPGLKSDVFPYWKIRLSYSEVGNDPEPFLTNPTYSITSGIASTKTRMENTDLQPERTKSYEVGTNIHFFKSKLQIDATWYKSSTYNQFFEPALSASSKWTSVIVNAGQVDNTGIELSARYGDDFGVKDFHWDTYLTYSHNKNKIVSLLDNWYVEATGETVSLKRLDVGGYGGVKNILYEGGSMSDIYVTTLATDEKGYLQQTSTGNVIADYSDEGLIYAGDTAPKHLLSWGNNFSYKGFNLSFLFTARLGGVAVSKTQAVMDYYGISQATADARDRGYVIINGMQSPNVKEYYQVLGANDGVMSMYVYDATNIRLSELSFGYDFPVKRWCNWLKGLNLSFVGHNLFMLYKKAPFDPEMTSSTGTYNQGVDYFMQPSTRNIGFSLKIKL
ncbi:MAG: SusC/RagA family TonB-linked outer membrane protein [Candidatus Cryptobacteroides sp.]